jgi:polysaccharide export outer membrane protein
MKNKVYILALLAIVSVLLTSCYNYRSVGLLQGKKIGLPEYEKTVYVPYKLKVNDELIFDMLSADETLYPLIAEGLSQSGGQGGLTYRIYTDGTVDLPFLRKIPVVGLTIREATEVIEKRYKEILPDAAIKLVLANRQFTVIGEGGTGVFYMNRDKLTIFQALALSGFVRDEADFSKIKIIRETDQGSKILEFDLRPISLIESEYYYVYPNDVIYIQKSSSSFYKVKNYSVFLGLISTSLTLLLTALTYFK